MTICISLSLLPFASQISLTIPNNQSITIGGNHPEYANLTPGTQCGIFQCCSDNICLTFTPGNGADFSSSLRISCTRLTQFGGPFVVNAEHDGCTTGKFINCTMKQI
jgi:hypothetical protein